MSCTPLGDGRLHFTGDPREICFEGRHLNFAIAAGVLAVLVSIGVPAVLLLVLWRARRRGKLFEEAEDGEHKPHQEMAYLHALYAR